MDVTVARVAPQYPGETETYSNDRVRLLRVDQKAAVTGPQTDFHTTGWKALTPQSAANFSAIGYFLGRKREEETGVPQGIICNSWGGTPIEAWVPEDSLSDYPRYLDKLHLYTPQYVETQNKANALMNNRWTEELNSKDPGLKEGWTGSCDDSRWKEYNQYDRAWAQQNGRGIIGSVWMRQHVHIDKAHDGMDLRGGAVPVLCGEGVEGELLDAEAHAFRSDSPDSLYTGLVAVAAVFTSFCGPSAIAVHDDGNMVWDVVHIHEHSALFFVTGDASW